MKGGFDYRPVSAFQLEHRIEGLFPYSTALIPVQVDWLAELSGIRFEHVPTLKQNFSIDGLLAFDPVNGAPWICIDRRIAQGADDYAYNIAIAEQLAHHILHREIYQSIDTIDDIVRLLQSPQWNLLEDEAKRGMRAILMPARAFELAAANAYRKVVAEQGFANEEMFLLAMNNHISQLFRVRHTDVHHRMGDSLFNLHHRIKLSIAKEAKQLMSCSDTNTASAKRQQFLFDFFDGKSNSNGHQAIDLKEQRVTESSNSID